MTDPLFFCPETHNNLIANKITSRNKINNGNSYPLVQAYRLKNPKNVILGHLNVHSERNKIEAAEDLRRNNFFFWFSETKLDFLLKNFNVLEV